MATSVAASSARSDPGEPSIPTTILLDICCSPLFSTLPILAAPAGAGIGPVAQPSRLVPPGAIRGATEDGERRLERAGATQRRAGLRFGGHDPLGRSIRTCRRAGRSVACPSRSGRIERLLDVVDDRARLRRRERPASALSVHSRSLASVIAGGSVPRPERLRPSAELLRHACRRQVIRSPLGSAPPWTTVAPAASSPVHASSVQWPSRPRAAAAGRPASSLSSAPASGTGRVQAVPDAVGISWLWPMSKVAEGVTR